MAKDYQAIASGVVEHVGGKENIVSVKHCITRLRFILKDESKAQTDEIKKISGVVDVVKGSGQYQVVIGPDVDDAYDAVLALIGTSFAGGEVAADAAAANGEKKSLFDQAADLVSGLFMPVLGGLSAVGLIKAILIILTNTGLLSTESGIYIVMYAASDALMRFLPFALAVTAAERFNCNKFTALAVVSVLLYPTIVDANANGDALSFGPIPVTLMNYASSVIPAILTVFVLSKLEKVVNKIVPKAVRFFLAPTICVAIMVPVMLIALGPVSMLIGNAFAAAFMFVYNLAPIVAAIAYGALYPVLIIFGAHWAIMPIQMNNYAVLGYDWISPLSFGCTYAIVGACFAVFVKTRNARLKEIAGDNTVVALLAGVTEPAIYGVTLKYKRPFALACVSSGIASIFISVASYHRMAPVGLNLFTIPALASFPGGWAVPVCVITSFVLAFVLTYFFGFNDTMIPESER